MSPPFKKLFVFIEFIKLKPVPILQQLLIIVNRTSTLDHFMLTCYNRMVDTFCITFYPVYKKYFFINGGNTHENLCSAENPRRRPPAVRI